MSKPTTPSSSCRPCRYYTIASLIGAATIVTLSTISGLSPQETEAALGLKDHSSRDITRNPVTGLVIQTPPETSNVTRKPLSPRAIQNSTLMERVRENFKLVTRDSEAKARDSHASSIELFRKNYGEAALINPKDFSHLGKILVETTLIKVRDHYLTMIIENGFTGIYHDDKAVERLQNSLLRNLQDPDYMKLFSENLLLAIRTRGMNVRSSPFRDFIFTPQKNKSLTYVKNGILEYHRPDAPYANFGSFTYDLPKFTNQKGGFSFDEFQEMLSKDSKLPNAYTLMIKFLEIKDHDSEEMFGKKWEGKLSVGGKSIIRAMEKSDRETLVARQDLGDNPHANLPHTHTSAKAINRLQRNRGEGRS